MTQSPRQVPDRFGELNQAVTTVASLTGGVQPRYKLASSEILSLDLAAAGIRSPQSISVSWMVETQDSMYRDRGGLVPHSEEAQ